MNKLNTNIWLEMHKSRLMDVVIKDWLKNELKLCSAYHLFHTFIINNKIFH